jgi:hypothetical protein
MRVLYNFRFTHFHNNACQSSLLSIPRESGLPIGASQSVLTVVVLLIYHRSIYCSEEHTPPKYFFLSILPGILQYFLLFLIYFTVLFKFPIKMFLLIGGPPVTVEMASRQIITQSSTYVSNGKILRFSRTLTVAKTWFSM